MNLESYLPADLQGPSTTITKVAAGLSGAGVYRVEANGATYALKVSDELEAADRWRRKLHIQQMAAYASLSPRIVHVDEGRRAVVSEFVIDQPFPAQFFNPATRDAALAQLGETLRRVHDLPLHDVGPGRHPREFLGEITRRLDDGFVVPAFVSDAIKWALTQEPPPPDRADVVSHNDVNPSNMLFDGKNILLVDWEQSGRNDPYYDLAAISVFFRMDAETCRRLIECHDRASLASLTPRFLYVRRFMATLIGAMFMRLARTNGHGGPDAASTPESVMSLSEFYQAMREGRLSVASGDGQIVFGLALIKESVSL